MQLVSSDSQVEGTHFNLKWIDALSLGKRCISVSLSDIAAMGGTPKHVIVSLILPNYLSVDFIKKLYIGINQQTRTYKANVIGGNISGGSERLIIDVTVIGEIKPDAVVTRSEAKPGDHIYLSGDLGNGVAGLEILRKFDDNYPSNYMNIVDKCLNPVPRIAVGRLIANSGCATSMIDVSDGLSSDLGHICNKSQVGAVINFDLLPRDTLLEEISSEISSNVKQMVLNGGDCYELLFTLKGDTPKSTVKSLEDGSGVKLTRIGSIVPREKGVVLKNKDGSTETLKPLGWNHFN